jgi:hypothetical protein
MTSFEECPLWVISRHVRRKSRYPLRTRSGHFWPNVRPMADISYCLITVFYRLQIIFDPVSGEIDADLAVVDVGMLCAAFFGREDLDCLVF